MKSKSDIGFLEAIETALDFIVDKTIVNLSEYHTIDTEERNYIEFNKFERANIIISNFYDKRQEFDISNSATTDKLIELIYESLVKPFIMNGTDMSDIDYLQESNITSLDEDSFLFNNNIFSWYEFSDYKNTNRKELAKIVSNLIKTNQNNKIYSLNEIDVNLYNAIISNPELLKQLNWRTFEKLLANILEKFEYEVELFKGTKDGGIDIIAMKNQSPFGINRYLIQAKRWKDKIGVEPVRSLIWAHNEYRATKSCLATTSVFTKGAWELADKYKWQVELRDYNKMIEWIQLAVKNKKV